MSVAEQKHESHGLKIEAKPGADPAHMFRSWRESTLVEANLRYVDDSLALFERASRDKDGLQLGLAYAVKRK